MEKFIPVDKLLKFTSKKKNYSFRFDHSWNIKEKGKININYGYPDSERPIELDLTLKYLDLSKDILKNQNIESHEVHKIIIPKPQLVGKSEVPIDFKIKDGSKVLWKISFKAKTALEKSYLHFAFGN